MSQVGKFLFAFIIASICFTGALAILSMQTGTPVPQVNIGTTDVYTNLSSNANITSELLAQTSGYGLGFVVILLFVFAAIIVLAAIALIGRKR